MTAPIEYVDLDHIAVAVERWADAWPRFVGVLGGRWMSGGQGPGFAELPTRNTWRVGVLAADKAGPAAFNVPVYRAVERALAQEAFRVRYGDSLAFEIFDVHEHRRIFLDARAHREEIATLLGAANLFNVKRLWSLPQVVNQHEAVKGAVQDILLAASTEKLFLPVATAVMHTPEQQIDAPIAIDAGS